MPVVTPQPNKHTLSSGAALLILANDISPEALATYGETLADILFIYTETEGSNETDILLDALRNQNEAELAQLDDKIAVYANYIDKTKALPVPQPMTQRHLNLLNSYQSIMSDIIAMRNAFSDPMLALLRLKRYQEDAQVLYISLNDLYSDLIAKGITWEEGSSVRKLMEAN